MIFPGQKESPLSDHRSEMTATQGVHFGLSTLALYPSLIPKLPLSLTTWHSAKRSLSICSHSQAEETLRDRRMDKAVGKIGAGRVNSKVSDEGS